jgi:tetratricopeptide (TPR) repeat protein
MAAVVGLLLGRFAFTGRSGVEGTGAPAPVARGTEAEVNSLQAWLRTFPDDPVALTRLASAYLARGRETGEPSWTAKAAEAVDRSRAIDPASPETTTVAGLLALTRHDFGAALELGLAASAARPASADPMAVVVDALVELGRYEEAVDAAQRMVNLRPSLASLARVSYLRELHGDRPGAVAAMAQAVAAGSGVGADVAGTEVLLGDLHLGGGDLVTAEAAYQRALELVPGNGPSEVGLARIEVARGDVAAAVDRLDRLVTRLPGSAWAALLGDLHGAAGRSQEARAQYELVRRIEELNRLSGMDVDLELARFEADRGDAEKAVVLARSALAKRPTVYASDALAWALRQAGRPAEALAHARDAVRLGTVDGVLWYHLAAIEADLGLVDDARQHVARAFEVSPYLTVLDLPEATALAGRLGRP